jgi:pyruvate kinase
MNVNVLVTLGPSSVNKTTIEELSKQGVSLFRINLSHTSLDDIAGLIESIQSWTDIPICLDSEGAQLRNQVMTTESVFFSKNDMVVIHHSPVVGDCNNISFTPHNAHKEFRVGDRIRVDFDSVVLRIVERQKDCHIALVCDEGCVGSNKAADIDRKIQLNPVTVKDEAAFRVGLDMGVNNFSLSFTNRASDVHKIRSIIGSKSNLISKIESIEGVLNLVDILPIVDQILIDRGDLSREISIEKIPFIQRMIISLAKSKDVPVYVATNLLESMIKSKLPTRAEANDVASTLLMGADGLVLAAETAIGKYPVDAVKMINSIIVEYNRWSPESSFKDVIY